MRAEEWSMDTADYYWRTVVGKAQGEEMWLLQRICEKDRQFYPLPGNFKGFKRGVMFYESTLDKEVSAVSESKQLITGLGSNFALYKGTTSRERHACAGSVRQWGGRSALLTSMDLIAISRLVEDAKANIVEFRQEQELSSTYAKALC